MILGPKAQTSLKNRVILSGCRIQPCDPSQERLRETSNNSSSYLWVSWEIPSNPVWVDSWKMGLLDFSQATPDHPSIQERTGLRKICWKQPDPEGIQRAFGSERWQTRQEDQKCATGVIQLYWGDWAQINGGKGNHFKEARGKRAFRYLQNQITVADVWGWREAPQVSEKDRDGARLRLLVIIVHMLKKQ